MSLKIVNANGVNFPAAYCDKCERVHSDKSPIRVYWRLDDPTTPQPFILLCYFCSADRPTCCQMSLEDFAKYFAQRNKDSSDIDKTLGEKFKRTDQQYKKFTNY